jgi:hypothetical protein
MKEIKNDLPVVMITKNEEEGIMEAAIGSEMADYLIKPVKPNQLLLVVKRITEQRRLITEKTTTNYRQEFSSIGNLISSARKHTDWTELYRKITFWESELEKSTDPGMNEILKMQENDANNAFVKYLTNHYLTWLDPDELDKPVLSPSLFSKKIFPNVQQGRPVFFILIDNLRFDQWKILPTATQYSRNAIFSGLMPSAIAAILPEFWVEDDEEEGKNNFEEELFKYQLARKGLKYKWSYHKIISNQEGRKVNEKIKQMLDNDINILVYNFVDMLSHARTEIGLIRDLANDEKAYRSLTRSWFVHSPLYELLITLSTQPVKIIFSTDHGTIRVQNPIKVIGDRKTSSNLRYKMGRNLDYNPRQVFELRFPEKAGLPKTNITSKYIFALNKDFLVYQNNYNYYAGFYKDTFQHGGISMQEIMLPVACLEPVS